MEMVTKAEQYVFINLQIKIEKDLHNISREK